MQSGCYSRIPFSHARMPVDSLNCFSTSASDLDLVPSASGLAWPAPSLRLGFVGVVKLGGSGASSSSSESRRGIGSWCCLSYDTAHGFDFRVRLTRRLHKISVSAWPSTHASVLLILKTTIPEFSRGKSKTFQLLNCAFSALYNALQ
jgi:hypothetical protein